MEYASARRFFFQLSARRFESMGLVTGTFEYVAEGDMEVINGGECPLYNL